jgi:hemerythrin-like domain-containing protein
LVSFLKIFADKCHHGKEENYLFEEMVKAGVPNKGGPIGVMLLEHQKGREYIALMSKSLAANQLNEFKIHATHYSDLLTNHITKENNVLFTMADKILNEAKQDKLFEKFEAFEKSVIGHGVHEKLHAMIHQWEVDFEMG